MAWYDEFGSSFWLTLSGAFFAFLGLIVRASLKSNCKNFSCCCGLFKCVRDTTADLDDLELTTTATNR
jgi:hypothetical protein